MDTPFPSDERRLAFPNRPPDLQFAPMSYPPSGTNPAAAPIPVQPLTYSLPFRQGRPGIITALAVMCIIVASLNGIGSLLSGGYAFLFYTASKAQARMSAASTVTTTYSSGAVAPTLAPPPQAGAGTVPMGDTGVAVNVLRPMLSLDAAHVRELNHLLRHHGRQIFGEEDDFKFTTTSVRSAILSSKPLTADSAQPAQFTTAQGTVEIFVDHAVFTSADGSLELRTSMRPISDQTIHHAVTNPAAMPAPPTTTALTPAQVKKVMAAVSGTGVALNAAETQALKTAISDPNQSLVTPGAATPVIMAVRHPDGNAAITFDTGDMLVLSPQGKTISSGPPKFNFNVKGSTATILAIEAAASGALAIYLLIVGVFLLRPILRGRKLVAIFAVLKIPLAIVVAIGWPMLAWEMMQGLSTSSALGTTAPTAGPYVVWGIITAVVGLAFPVALLITISTRPVRNYYNSVRPDAAKG